MPVLQAPIPRPSAPAGGRTSAHPPVPRPRVGVIQYARRFRPPTATGVSDLSICDTVVNGAAIPIDRGFHAFVHPRGLVVLGRLRGRFCRVHAALVLITHKNRAGAHF